MKPAPGAARQATCPTRWPGRAGTVATLLVVLCVSGSGPAVMGGGQTPQALVDRAEADFAAGRIAESVGSFDKLAALVPDAAPMLWQRGIGLYYLGRFRECAAQFASFHAANPADVESAVWHFACVARAESPDRAKAALLAAGPDGRIMRTAIYEMFRGRRSPAEIVEAAEVSVGTARFYAAFYAGLYSEVTGDRQAALAYITSAASDAYRSVGGFMNIVAQVHFARLTGAGA